MINDRAFFEISGKTKVFGVVKLSPIRVAKSRRFGFLHRRYKPQLHLEIPPSLFTNHEHDDVILSSTDSKT